MSEGTTITLTCSEDLDGFVGSINIKYTFLKNDVIIHMAYPPNGRNFVKENMTTADSGSYTCIYSFYGIESDTSNIIQVNVSGE